MSIGAFIVAALLAACAPLAGDPLVTFCGEAGALAAMCLFFARA
jgi:hypothetical protein